MICACVDSHNDDLDLDNGKNVLNQSCIVYKVHIESAKGVSHYMPSLCTFDYN